MAVLKPGQIDADGNWIEVGMAYYIEQEMPDLPPEHDPEDSGKVGRRQFFAALSAGIINYIKANQNDAFVVHVGSNDGTLEIR